MEETLENAKDQPGMIITDIWEKGLGPKLVATASIKKYMEKYYYPTAMVTYTESLEEATKMVEKMDSQR